MNRRGIVPTAVVLPVSMLLAVLAFAVRGDAQQYRPRSTSRSIAERDSQINGTAPEEPRAGSILGESRPAYQRAIFEPPPKMPASKPTRSTEGRRPSRDFAKAPPSAEFDEADARSKRRVAEVARLPVAKVPAGRLPAAPNSGELSYVESSEDSDPPPRERAGRRRSSINRAAYQDPAAGSAAPAMPSSPPEDLPLPPQVQTMPGAETVPYGVMPPDGGDPMFAADGGCASGDCGPYGECGDACGPCNTCVDWYPGKDLTLLAGVHGFKNAVDEGQNGNFGFHEGVNWSSPFWNAAGIGFQVGFQATHSDFHDTAFFTDDRSQYFLTTGFFRRQTCGQGWQWGVVYDHLFDEFVEDFEVGQIRGELSYLFRGHELGYWFATGVSDDEPGADSTTGISSFEAVDMHAFFYRRRLMNGGEGRLWGGFTEESDGIIGGDLRVPVACDWDIVAAFNYLAPQDDAAVDGSFPEAWNIGINLVWYVCPQGALQAGGSRYRPLLSVADNGTLVVNTVR